MYGLPHSFASLLPVDWLQQEEMAFQVAALVLIYVISVKEKAYIEINIVFSY